MTAAPKSLPLFGSLPVAYYLFDYATVIYPDALHQGLWALSEFLPTALIVFYVMFLSAYHVQMQHRTDAELQRSMLSAALKQSEVELAGLRSAESQMAIYHHDMRHHLAMIQQLISSGNPEQAESYIQTVQTGIDAVAPTRFCENELVNLLCSSFYEKAQRMEVELAVDVQLPQFLSVSDMELCSILSNGLENALHAVSALEKPDRRISLYCKYRLNKLLIEMQNPYRGTIRMENGLPISGQIGHGYGCRSIQAIARQYGGICVFSAEGGIFQFQILLPAKSATAPAKEPGQE